MPLRLSAAAAGVVLLLAAAPAHGAPSSAVKTEHAPAAANSVTLSDSDMAPDGTAAIAWAGLGGNAGKVFMATREPGATWSAGTEVLTGITDLSGVELELGPDGSAVIITTSLSFGWGMPTAHYRDSSGVWSTGVPLDTEGRPISASRVRAVYDPAGNLTVAWRSSSVVVANSRPKLTGTWTGAEVIDTTAASSIHGLDLDVDAAGNATVAWSAGALDETEQWTQEDVKARTRSGPAGAWGDEVHVGSGIEKGANPGRSVRNLNLDVNGAGEAVVAWMGWTSNNSDRRVRAAMRESATGAWTAEQQVTPGSEIVFDELGAGIDGDGNATVLSITDTAGGGELRQSVRSLGGAWSTTVIGLTPRFSGVRMGFEQAENGAWMAAWQRTDWTKRVVARTAAGTYHSFDMPAEAYESLGIRTSLDAAGNGLLGYVANTNPADIASALHPYTLGWDATGPTLTNLQTPSTPEAGQELSFSVDADDLWSNPASVSWDFGDDTTDATGTDVTHTYGENGTYTVTVTATDALGNVSTETRQLVVQADQPPVVDITDGHLALSNDNDPSFTWTVDDPGATVTCELTGPVGSGAHPSGACAGLSRGYTNLADGDYVFTVAAQDAGGQSADDNVNFTIDTVGPTSTAFTGGPDEGDRIKDRTPTFTFSATGETDPEFECRYDSTSNEDWETCDDDGWSPPTLGDGEHTVDVRAIDLAGNPDTTPASVSFVVDNVPPATTVTQPASPTKLSQLSFTLGATGTETGETISYRCRFYRAGGTVPSLASCDKDLVQTVPAGAENDGTWTLEAVASDELGNEDETAATASVVVDRVAPGQPTIDSGPDGPTPDRRPAFTFSGESGASFACRIQLVGDDETAFESCDDGTYQPDADLPQGQSYTFHVRATDAAGNTGAERVREFSVDTAAVDTTAPQTRIDSGPGEGTSITDRRPSLAFSTVVDGDAAGFRCSLHREGAAPAPADCTSPFRPGADLAFGAWVFEVAARDAAGNEDATPARRTFSVVEPAKQEQPRTEEPKKTETPATPPVSQVPPGFTPMAAAVEVGRMPALAPRQSGGRWSWQHVARAEADLAALGLHLDVRRVEMGADKVSPKSLRDQLRREDDGAGAVMVQDPPAGAPLSGTPTAPQVVTLGVFDPARDKTVQSELDEDLEAAERRLERQGKKVPRCKYLIYSADNLMIELGAMTLSEARSALRKEKCDFSTRFKKAHVADEIISDVRKGKDGRSIDLLVWTPKQSQFVITVREEPADVGTDDLSFAIGDGSDEWTLRTSGKQDSKFVAQVNELATGKFVTGAKVELWEPGAEKPAYSGTTDANGEVSVTARLRTPGTLGLFAKVRDADGDVMEGFRDLRAVTRRGSFTTPTGRTMRESGGRWSGPKGVVTGLVPANAGIGIAGPTVRTATVSRRPVQFALQTPQGPGMVDGTAPAIDLSNGSRLVLSGDGVIIASGGPTLAAAGKARAASALGDGPRARAAFLDAPLLGSLAGGLLWNYVIKPRLTTPIVAKAVAKAQPQAKPPGPQIQSAFIPGSMPGSMSKDGGQVIDTSGANVIGIADDRVVIRKDGVEYTIAARVISTGGGNFDVQLDDGTQLKLSGVISTGGGNVISTGGGNVISTGGGNVISTGGGNVISTGGGNVIATGGGNVISVGGGNVISTGGGNVISTGGGNVISTGGGNFLPTGAGVISTGGGNVISVGGGNVISVGGGN